MYTVPWVWVGEVHMMILVMNNIEYIMGVISFIFTHVFNQKTNIMLTYFSTRQS